MHVSGSNVTATQYTSKHPAGGSWSTPAVLSVPGDAAVNPHVVADAAGTFAASWLDTTTQALNVLTSSPGSGFGPATTFTVSAFGDLKIAPGHAVLSFRTIPADPMSITNEPVS